MMPCRVLPQRPPQTWTWRSVRNPPNRQATPPKNNGPPEATTNPTPESLRSALRNGVIQVAKNDHPALLQKYMKLNAHMVGLLSMRDQERGAGLEVTLFPCEINACSASLTAATSSGES